MFCEDCNRIRLTSTGFLKKCLHYNYGVDLKKHIRSNISDKDLNELIYSNIYDKPQEHLLWRTVTIKKINIWTKSEDRYMGKVLAICISEKKGTLKMK